MLIFSAYTFMLLPFCFLFVFSVFTVAFLHIPCYVFVHFVSFHLYFEVTQQRSWSFCLSLNLHMFFDRGARLRIWSCQITCLIMAGSTVEQYHAAIGYFYCSRRIYKCLYYCCFSLNTLYELFFYISHIGVSVAVCNC